MPKPPKAAKKTKPQQTIRTPDIVTSTNEMAEILGITTRWLNKLVADRTVPSEGRGKFRIGSVVTAYATFLKEGAEKRPGSSSDDKLKDEKVLNLKLERARKDRDLVSMDEAEGFFAEVAGEFVSTLNALPAQITGVPAERQRINGIIDIGRQRLIDSLAKKRQAFVTGREASSSEGED